jgi:hypothetical protein
MRLDVGDVGHPNMVRHIDFELTVHCVVSDDGWFVAIQARTTFVANLRCDAYQASQSGHTVLGAGLTCIKKIIMQLASFGIMLRITLSTALRLSVGQCAVAFFSILRSSKTRASSLFKRLISAACSATSDRTRGDFAN